MKSILLRILVIALLVTFLGTGIMQVINYVENKLITMTVELIENSEFVHKIRDIVTDIAKDVISELIREGADFKSVVVS